MSTGTEPSQSWLVQSNWNENAAVLVITEIIIHDVIS